ncbi:MAG: MCE family protein [Opitutales bacterium]|nr:MCE family protein [Opitutales bacterium]
MNQTLQTVKVGLFFLLGLSLIYVVYTVIGDEQLRQRGGYTVHAVFDDVKSLNRGADVRVAGVRIGEVESTDLVRGKGRVVIRIQQDYEIPADSVASVAMASLLGQNFISLRYGDADTYLRDGDSITTRASADINDVVGQISELGEKIGGIADSFSSFGGDTIDELIENLTAMIKENRGSMKSTFENLDALTGQLRGTEGTIGKLINDDSAYNELMATVAEIKGAAEDARSTLSGVQGIFERIDSGEGTLGKLLADDSIARELEQTMANLNAFSAKLNSGEGTLGKLVSDDELYRELQGILQKAQRALDGMGEAGPITAVGAISGALF